MTINEHSDNNNLHIKLFLFSSIIFFFLNDPFIFNNIYFLNFKTRIFISLFLVYSTFLLIYNIAKKKKKLIFNKKNFLFLGFIVSFYILDALIDFNFFEKKKLRFLFLYCYVLSLIIIIKYYKYNNPKIILNSFIFFSQIIAILAIIGWLLLIIFNENFDYLNFSEILDNSFRNYKFTIFGAYIAKDFNNITLFRTSSFFKEPIYAAVFFFINLTLTFRYSKYFYSGLIFLLAGITTLSYTFIALLAFYTIFQFIMNLKNFFKRNIKSILFVFVIIFLIIIKIFENITISEVIKYSSYKDRYDRNVGFVVRFIQSDTLEKLFKTQRSEHSLKDMNIFLKNHFEFMPKIKRSVPPDSTFTSILENRGLLFLIFFFNMLLYCNSKKLYLSIIILIGLAINISTLPIYLFQYCLYGLLRKN